MAFSVPTKMRIQEYIGFILFMLSFPKMAGLMMDGVRVGGYRPPANLFLLKLDHEDETCFCGECRARRFNEISVEGVVNIKAMCLDILPFGREKKANIVFRTTLLQILYGQAYKEACLAETTYVYWKSWAKTQPEFEYLVNGSDQRKREFDDLASEITEAASVFHSWDKIIENLTDYRMTSIDARTFSVHMFYRAKSIDWCLGYNEKLRKKSKLVGELPYSQEKVEDIFTYMINSGIFQDIKHDPKLAAGIGEALQRKMTSHCRRTKRRHDEQ